MNQYPAKSVADHIRPASELRVGLHQAVPFGKAAQSVRPHNEQMPQNRFANRATWCQPIVAGPLSASDVEQLRRLAVLAI